MSERHTETMEQGSKQGDTGTKGFLEVLKEWKEVIAIVVFFVSGVLWIFAFFATKTELQRFSRLVDREQKES